VGGARQGDRFGTEDTRLSRFGFFIASSRHQDVAWIRLGSRRHDRSHIMMFRFGRLNDLRVPRLKLEDADRYGIETFVMILQLLEDHHVPLELVNHA